MAIVDLKYNELLKKILTEGEKVFDSSREMHTIQIPSYELNLVDLQNIPVLTTKKINTKSVLAELEMFVKGITNIKFLRVRNCHIWDKDAYQYYLRLCKRDDIKLVFKEDFFFRAVDNNFSQGRMEKYLPKGYQLGDLGPIYGAQWNENDQLLNCIHRLRLKQFDRRLIVNAWNPKDLPDMALPPCHWSYEFLQYKDGFILKWHQRSVDTFLGLPFNITSYFVLGRIISMLVALPFYGTIGDLSNIHIYENHFDQVQELLSRDPNEYTNRDIRLTLKTYEATTLRNYQMGLMSLKTTLLNLGISNMEIQGYKSHPYIKAEMVAPLV